jgi:hypothetical protein
MLLALVSIGVFSGFYYFVLPILQSFVFSAGR